MKDEQQAERPNRFSISFMGFQTNQSASHPAIRRSGQWWSVAKSAGSLGTQGQL